MKYHSCKHLKAREQQNLHNTDNLSWLVHTLRCVLLVVFLILIPFFFFLKSIDHLAQGTQSFTKSISCYFLTLLAPGQAASLLLLSTNPSLLTTPQRTPLCFNWLRSWHEKMGEVSVNTTCPISLAFGVTQHFACCRTGLGAFSCELRVISIFTYPVNKGQVQVCWPCQCRNLSPAVGQQFQLPSLLQAQPQEHTSFVFRLQRQHCSHQHSLLTQLCNTWRL